MLGEGDFCADGDRMLPGPSTGIRLGPALPGGRPLTPGPRARPTKRVTCAGVIGLLAGRAAGAVGRALLGRKAPDPAAASALRPSSSTPSPAADDAQLAEPLLLGPSQPPAADLVAADAAARVARASPSVLAEAGGSTSWAGRAWASLWRRRPTKAEVAMQKLHVQRAALQSHIDRVQRDMKSTMTGDGRGATSSARLRALVARKRALSRQLNAVDAQEARLTSANFVAGIAAATNATTGALVELGRAASREAETLAAHQDEADAAAADIEMAQQDVRRATQAMAPTADPLEEEAIARELDELMAERDEEAGLAVAGALPSVPSADPVGPAPRQQRRTTHA